MRVAFRINGSGTSLDVPPSTLLSSLLREKFGRPLEECAGSDCGQCAVTIDGAPARSCMRLAVQCDRKVIDYEAPEAEGGQTSTPVTAGASLRNESVKPAPFDYLLPNGMSEAIEMLADRGPGRVALLAGGVGLIPRLKLHVTQPEAIVDLRRLDGLRMITASEESLVIGACATHEQLGRSRIVAMHGGALLRDAARAIEEPTARHVGTIGGCVVRSKPVTGWHAALWAVRARIALVGPDGERRVLADDFFAGLPGVRPRFGEVLTAFHIPTARDDERSFYSVDNSVGVACRLRVVAGSVKQISIAVHGLGNGLFRAREIESALRGIHVSDAVLAAARVGVRCPGLSVDGVDATVALRLLVESLQRVTID